MTNVNKSPLVQQIFMVVGWPLPELSNVNSLIYIFVTRNFINNWINTLNKNITWSSLAHQNKFKENIQKSLKSKKTKLLKTSIENIKLR